MKFQHAIAAALGVCAAITGPAARAQTAPPEVRPARPAVAASAATANVVDPSVAVPAVAYRSVFGASSTGVESGRADWRQANDEVGRLRRGHADILQWENRHPGVQP